MQRKSQSVLKLRNNLFFGSDNNFMNIPSFFAIFVHLLELHLTFILGWGGRKIPKLAFLKCNQLLLLSTSGKHGCNAPIFVCILHFGRRGKNKSLKFFHIRHPVLIHIYFFNLLQRAIIICYCSIEHFLLNGCENNFFSYLSGFLE